MYIAKKMNRTFLVLGALATFFGGIASGTGFAATIAFYTFENGVPGTIASGAGTILDSSGNGFNGTAYNSPVYSSNVPSTPFPNSASMAFGGIDHQTVSIPDQPQLALTRSLTLEAYVNVASVHTGYNQYILFRGDDRGGFDPYTLWVGNDGTNPPRFGFSVTNASNVAASVSAPIPSLDQWFEVAGTLDDSTGIMDLYINGVLASTTTTTIRSLGLLDPTQSPGLGIGNVQDPNYPDVGDYAQACDGLVDEARISDQALPPSQLLGNLPEPTTTVMAVVPFAVLGGRPRRSVRAG